MLEDRLDAVADGMNRRLVAGVEQEDAGRDQFVLAEPAVFAFGARSWLMRSSRRSERRARGMSRA